MGASRLGNQPFSLATSIRGVWSNSSMNCWSSARDLGWECRRYSSNIRVRPHCWIFRTQPTTHPVRCYKLLYFISSKTAHMVIHLSFWLHTFPLLQWINTGWLRRSRTTRSARSTRSLGTACRNNVLLELLLVSNRDSREWISYCWRKVPCFQACQFGNVECLSFSWIRGSSRGIPPEIKCYKRLL